MKLYYSPGACSLSPHIALREAGIAFEPVQASTKTHKLEDGTDYYSINPLGYVPLLELDDGTQLREGPAIVQYIADQVPTKNLAPANGTLRALPPAGMAQLHRHRDPQGLQPAVQPGHAGRRPRRSAGSKLKSRYQWIDGQLAGKQYLMGDHFSVADGYLFTVTNWAKPTGIDIAACANVQAWHARVGARPAVQEAMRAEGLLK